MAYATGSIVGTGPAGLLNALATFLTDNGWTQDALGDDNTDYIAFTGHDGTGRRLHVHKNAADGTTMYFNLRSVVRGAIFADNYNSTFLWDGTHNYSEVSGIGINGSSGYSGAATWDGQADYPGKDGMGSGLKSGASISLLTSNIPTYWFFQNGDTVHIVVEYTAGFFMHMAFGCVKKSCVFTGGQYFTASLPAYYPGYWSYYRVGGKISENECPCNFMSHTYGVMGIGAMRLTLDGVDTWRWQGYMGSNGGGTYINSLQFAGFKTMVRKDQCYTSPGLAQLVNFRTPNYFNGLSVIQPNHVLVKDSGGFFRYVGYTEGSNWINVTNYSPGDEITISGDTYKVFPMWSKDQTQWPTPVDYYQPFGLAIKKVV